MEFWIMIGFATMVQPITVEHSKNNSQSQRSTENIRAKHSSKSQCRTGKLVTNHSAAQDKW